MRKITVEVDVAGRAPSGCHLVVADLYVPAETEPFPVVWCCVPGGGISRAYFDLDVPPSLGEYSMAYHLAERGQIVLTIDPPGVGGSDLPDDGYDLAPRVVSDVLHVVVQDVLDRIVTGRLDGVRVVSIGAVLGVGHSAGALLVACQQARHRTFDALALLGFSASGLPSVLNEKEAAYAERAEDLVAVLPEFVRARFGDPLPQWSSERSRLGMLEAPVDDVEAASSRAGSRLLAMVGMTALVPGSIKPELDQIDVPTIVALGEHDIAGSISALPGQLPSCHDLTLFTVVGAGHNHNVAESRLVLWDRMLRWIRSVDRGERLLSDRRHETPES
ncbi:MAG: alpha/beta fold hydrolase [Acidimicrobiales bacterium]